MVQCWQTLTHGTLACWRWQVHTIGWPDTPIWLLTAGPLWVVQYSTENSYMKSDPIMGHSLGAQLYLITYTLCPICCTPIWTWTSLSDSIIHLGLCFFQWNQAAPPSTSHLPMTYGVVWRMWVNIFAPSRSQLQMMHMLTLSDCSLAFSVNIVSNLSVGACYLAHLPSLTAKPLLYNLSTHLNLLSPNPFHIIHIFERQPVLQCC